MKSFILIFVVSVERKLYTASSSSCRYMYLIHFLAPITTIRIMHAIFLVALNGDLQVVMATKGEKSVFAFNMIRQYAIGEQNTNFVTQL